MCSVYTVGLICGCLIDRGLFYYQTLGERTLDPFTDKARAVPSTDEPLVHSYRTWGKSHGLHRGVVLPALRWFTDLNIYVQTSNPRLSTGLTSTSLDRAPGPSKNFVRGKAGNVPFWPGGLENASAGIPEELEDELVAEGKGIRTIPPGFTRGLRLPGEGEDETGLDGLEGVQKRSAAGQEDAVSRPL